MAKLRQHRRTLQPCEVHGCPVLTRSTRCAEHAQPGDYQWNKRAGIKQSGWQWGRTVQRILERDGRVCRWCGGRATTADHVVAVAEGGPDDDDNLVAACSPCNRRRGQELAARRRAGV